MTKKKPTRTLFSSDFWLQALERALKTVAQTAVAMLGAEALNVFQADLLATIGVSLGAGLLSVLTSIASAKVHGDDSPSLV
jgi:hypothetical protein